MAKVYHPVQPGFGFEHVMRNPRHGRFMAWYRRYGLLEGRAAVADVFSQPYAVEAGIDFDKAA
jgi:hypothetical protein